MTVLKLTQTDHAAPQEVAIVDPQRAILSSLKLFNSFQDFVTKQVHSAFVMATYTTFDSTMDITRNVGRISSTIISRWNVSEEQEELHPCFTNLSSTKNNGQNTTSEVSRILHSFLSSDEDEFL